MKNAKKGTLNCSMKRKSKKKIICIYFLHAHNVVAGEERGRQCYVQCKLRDEVRVQNQWRPPQPKAIVAKQGGRPKDSGARLLKLPRLLPALLDVEKTLKNRLWVSPAPNRDD